MIEIGFTVKSFYKTYNDMYDELYKNNEDSTFKGLKNIQISRFQEIFNQVIELKKQKIKTDYCDKCAEFDARLHDWTIS